MPVPLVADRAIVQELSELGVILLLFSIGLEFTFGKLLRVGGLAAVIAVAQVSVMLLRGDLAGRALGWTRRVRFSRTLPLRQSIPRARAPRKGRAESRAALAEAF